MSLSTGQDQLLRANRNQHPGAVGSEGLLSLLAALKRAAGNEVALPDVQTKTFVAAGSTSQVVIGSACTLYGVRIESGTALTSTLGVVARLTDNTIIRAALHCSSENAAECYFFGGAQGIGIPIVTSLELTVTAAANGTADPAAGDKPIVTVFYGV